MHGFRGERVLMRIHIGERDKFKGEPLYWAIVQLLRKRHYAGATVTRGIMAFGATKSPIIKAFSDRVFGAFRMSGMGVALGSAAARELGHLIASAKR